MFIGSLKGGKEVTDRCGRKPKIINPKFLADEIYQNVGGSFHQISLLCLFLLMFFNHFGYVLRMKRKKVLHLC